jgi:spore coat polysaccharide biosynthesis protein SpsF
VDTQEDFDVISAIFEHFYPSNPGFTLAQIIDFMQAHPELSAANRQVERRWQAFRQD